MHGSVIPSFNGCPRPGREGCGASDCYKTTTYTIKIHVFAVYTVLRKKIYAIDMIIKISTF
jgi:hypothetical protein